MAYAWKNQFVPYSSLAWGTKLSYGFNPASYYQDALNVETDPIVRQQYQDALTTYTGGTPLRQAKESSQGLLALGLLTGNPVLVTAGATQYGQVSAAQAAGGTVPTGTGALAYQQQYAAGSVQSYVDQRAALAVGLGIVAIFGIYWFARRRK